jgi:hypothetical protein
LIDRQFQKKDKSILATSGTQKWAGVKKLGSEE